MPANAKPPATPGDIYCGNKTVRIYNFISRAPEFLFIGSPPNNLPNKNGKDIAPGLFMDKFPGKG